MDTVRFICVAVMVLVHAHLMLVADKYYVIAETSGFFKITDQLMFIGLFITTLPMIAGYVFRMGGEYEFQGTVKLAILLSFLGFFMNVVTWGVDYLFSWNILQFISLSLVVIAILTKFVPVSGVFLLSLVTIFGAELLRGFLFAFSDNYLVTIFVGATDGSAYWAFFPWFGIVGIGFLFAHYQLKFKNSGPFRISAALVGVVLVAAAFFRDKTGPELDQFPVWSPTIFQPETWLILVVIGFSLVLLVFGNTFFNKVRHSKYGIINSYSRGILWIYIAQMFVGYKLSLWIKSLSPTDEPSLVYFSFIIFMFGFSWLVGVLSIKLLQEKKMVISLRKTNE
ncbi:MAG: heparan-alpha-glucosaminide N-acetyltransferase domain-containing protein [Patescibacteria group bacterium]|nr:heparan-alpha-glucosaminide N-acetyltransferase domain-containing protein [Patescibacteria group bacterium]